MICLQPSLNLPQMECSQGVELVDLDLEEARRMLRAFIETKPKEWPSGIGR